MRKSASIYFIILGVWGGNLKPELDDSYRNWLQLCQNGQDLAQFLWLYSLNYLKVSELIYHYVEDCYVVCTILYVDIGLLSIILQINFRAQSKEQWDTIFLSISIVEAKLLTEKLTFLWNE